jgi:hypothetical protein
VASKLGMTAISPPPKEQKGNAQFADFTFAPDGSLWAVTSKGLRRFDHIDQWPAPVAIESAPGESFTPDQALSSDAVWKVLLDRWRLSLYNFTNHSGAKSNPRLQSRSGDRGLTLLPIGAE